MQECSVFAWLPQAFGKFFTSVYRCLKGRSIRKNTLSWDFGANFAMYSSCTFLWILEHCRLPPPSWLNDALAHSRVASLLFMSQSRNLIRPTFIQLDHFSDFFCGWNFQFPRPPRTTRKKSRRRKKSRFCKPYIISRYYVPVQCLPVLVSQFAEISYGNINHLNPNFLKKVLSFNQHSTSDELLSRLPQLQLISFSMDMVSYL